jgi:hypothetical protein
VSVATQPSFSPFSSALFVLWRVKTRKCEPKNERDRPSSDIKFSILLPLVLTNMSVLYVRSRVVPFADERAHFGLVFIG